MSEEKLRELERAWRESGSPADELTYLTEQVRSGLGLDWDSYQRLAKLDLDAAAQYLLARVSAEGISLAAMCGHAAARMVLGNSAPQPAQDIWDWAYDLEQQFGRGLSIRAQVCAARYVLPLWDRVHACSSCAGEGCESCFLGCTDPRPREAIEATEAWQRCADCFDPERTYLCTEHNESRLQALAASQAAQREAEAAAFDEAMRELMLEFLRDAPRVSTLARLDLGGLIDSEEGLLVQKRPLLRVLRAGLHEFLYLPDRRSHSDVHDERISIRRVETQARALGAIEKRVAVEGKLTGVLVFPRAVPDRVPDEPVDEPAMWACKAATEMGPDANGSWALYAAARALGESRRPATDSRPRVLGAEIRGAICRGLVPI